MYAAKLILVHVLAVTSTFAIHSLDVSLHKTTAAPGGFLSVTCHAHSPIKGCEFYSEGMDEWFEVLEKNYTERMDDIKAKRHYTYNGKGFQNGDCGIFIPTATKKHNGEWMCNLHFDETDAKVAGMQFSVAEKLIEEDLQAFTLQNSTAINEKNAAFVCHSSEPISKCELLPPFGTQWIEPETYRSESVSPINDQDSGLLYYGTGLENGDCGLFLQNVRDTDTGIWICKVTTETDEYGLTQFVNLNGNSPVIKAVPLRPKDPSFTRKESTVENTQTLIEIKDSTNAKEGKQSNNVTPFGYIPASLLGQVVLSGVFLLIFTIGLIIYVLVKSCRNSSRKGGFKMDNTYDNSYFLRKPSTVLVDTETLPCKPLLPNPIYEPYSKVTAGQFNYNKTGLYGVHVNNQIPEDRSFANIHRQ